MKKIPTLFKRYFEGHKIIGITPEITDAKCEKAFKEGAATVKVDGACCAIIDGEFYKRFDAKKGKTPPKGAIACCEPDPVTGHWPHWVKVDPSNPADKWFWEAYMSTPPSHFAKGEPTDGTYEAIGPHFQGNPYGLEVDVLLQHGILGSFVERDFESIKQWLIDNEQEGLVFWLKGEPVCKIKRTDFGLSWPVK